MQRSQALDVGLRVLQGIIVGSVFGLALFALFVRSTGPPAATEAEQSELLIVFFLFEMAGTFVGSLAGAALGRRLTGRAHPAANERAPSGRRPDEP